MTNKSTVQQQFGSQSALNGYATSDIHARGESLTVLAELIHPQPNWRMLDVATGAGHTALTFAPRVAHVVATDITPAMLGKAGELAAERGFANVETRLADAESLPFDDATFDMVTCRLALHHFPHAAQAIAEFARVLKPGGTLGFTDNITVPDKTAAGYYNAFEKLRDPSHHWVYPLVRLEKMFTRAGFVIRQTRQLSKELEFHTWADRQNVSAENKEKLQAMMRELPEKLTPLFSPRWADSTLYFSLWEVVLVAEKA